MLQLLTPSVQLLSPKLLHSSASLVTRYCPPPRTLSVRARQASSTTNSHTLDHIWSSPPPLVLPSTQAATARLPVVALSSPLQCGLVSNIIQYLTAVLGPLPQTRRNLVYSWQMPLRASFAVMYHQLLTAVQETANDTTLDVEQWWRRGDSRYLGNCPPLLEYARQKGGELTTTQIRTWVNKQSEAWVKANLGVTKDEFKCYAIDHVLPTNKGGLNHPQNFYLLPPALNCSFGGRITIQKIKIVCLAVVAAVLEFHLHAMTYGTASIGPMKGSPSLFQSASY